MQLEKVSFQMRGIRGANAMNRFDNGNLSPDLTARSQPARRSEPISLAWFFALLIALFCDGCEQPSKPVPEQMAATAPARITLTSGDVVKLTFPGAPELNQSQKIRADGTINLPLVGEVDVAGKTVTSLQDDLAQRYKPQLKSSTVIVTLESSVTQVVVSGAVGRAGKLSFERPTSVFQAVMEAGGVSEYGSLRNVHLIRLVNGEQHTQILNLKPTLSGKTTRPYYVRDGDVIYVPRSVF